MAEAVLDASAVLAYIHAEPGSTRVADVLDKALVSAVNFAEIVSKLVDGGASVEQVDEIRRRLGFEVVDFDEALARLTGEFRTISRSLGLSLGDRACLALAVQQKLPAITADRQWSKVNIGVPVEVIR